MPAREPGSRGAREPGSRPRGVFLAPICHTFVANLYDWPIEMFVQKEHGTSAPTYIHVLLTCGCVCECVCVCVCGCECVPVFD